MSQKIPSTSLRLLLNRNFESIWYSQKNYADNFLSEHQFRSHIKKVSTSIDNSVFGRMVTASFPKKNAAHCSVLTHTKSNTNKSSATNNFNGDALSTINHSRIVQLVSDAKHQIFGLSNQLPIDFITSKSGSQKNKIEIVNQLQSKSYSEINFVRSKSLISSAYFIIDQIADSLQKNRSILPVVRTCLKLAEINPRIAGMRIVCSGRFRGIDRARLLGYSWGQIQRQKFSQKVDYASKPILTKTGLVGVKVWISLADPIHQS